MLQTGIKQVIAVNWVDRWQVYQRLQELSIASWCESNQPLVAEISNPTEAIQVWSVVRQITASRQQLILVLEKCWQYHQ